MRGLHIITVRRQATGVNKAPNAHWLSPPTAFRVEDSRTCAVGPRSFPDLNKRTIQSYRYLTVSFNNRELCDVARGSEVRVRHKTRNYPSLMVPPARRLRPHGKPRTRVFTSHSLVANELELATYHFTISRLWWTIHQCMTSTISGLSSWQSW